jgi:DNA ligase D-like protein (predicted 3'-phosphoesterase)
MASRKTDVKGVIPRPKRERRTPLCSNLSGYRRKRDFERTPEPSGARLSKKEPRLLYVIQRHQASRLHYDLRLQEGSVLKSWAVPKTPPEKAGERRLAVEVEDHPLDYGAFEGTIPEGEYGAGTVKIWDKGTYELLEAGPSKRLVSIQGRRLKGTYVLVKLRPGEGEKDKNWLFFKMKDDGTETGRREKA